MRNKNGFTLVELLAVIVILGIIMVIAIPAVLQIMTVAKWNSFKNYANKISNETIKQYTKDSLNGTQSETRIYNIEKELGLSNTGEFKGYSLISPSSNKVYLTLYNNEYVYVAIEVKQENLDNKLVKLATLSDDDKRDKLTAEYLCSIVEECTTCSYLKTNEDGTETYELITPEKHEHDAVLAQASIVRGAFAALVPVETITEIKYSENIPEGNNKKNISDSKSKNEVYLWNDGTVVYYGTKANNIFFNSDSKSLFQGFKAVTHIDTIKWRMDEVVNAQQMFHTCASLVSIDTSSWKFPQVTSMSGMFNGCTKLRSIDLKNWDVKKVTTLYALFYNCLSLDMEIDLTKWSFASLTNISYAFAASSANDQMVIEYIHLPNTSNIVSNMEAAFSNCKKLKKITNIETFATEKVEKLALAFKNCNKLEELDLSRWVLPNLATIDWAFQSCFLIKKLDLSHFNFTKVTSLAGLCHSCNALEEIKFGNKNFQNVTSTENAFFNNTNLKELDLSNAYMPKVTKMVQMFFGCGSLTKLNLSNVNVNSNETLQKTFYNCFSLTELNLDGFIDAALKDMSQAFANCSALKKLDLSSLNAHKVTNMSMTFHTMLSLEELDMTGIKSKPTNMNNTFNSDSKLKVIYVSSEFSNESVEEDKKTSTFHNCTSLPGYSSSKKSADYAKPLNDGGYLTIR